MGRHRDDKNSESSSESDSSQSSSSSSSSLSEIDVKRLKSSKKEKEALKKKMKKEKEKQRKKEEKFKKNHISKDDYYIKNGEFRIWLTEEKKKDFEDLPTKKAKELFNKFMKKWNKKKLPKKYYRGIDYHESAASTRTKYRWSFTDLNSDELTSVRGKVCNWNSPATFSTFGKQPTKSVEKRPNTLISQVYDEPIKTGHQKKLRGLRDEEDDSAGPVLGPMPAPPLPPETLSAASNTPSPAAHVHSADSFLMGGGDDISMTIKARKRKIEMKKEKKCEIYQSKLAAYNEKEAAKMKALLEVAKATKHENALW